ncbi:MAG: hypothetical protein ACFFCS_21120, partial [Candidatus Hodarchaeota archaeon]
MFKEQSSLNHKRNLVNKENGDIIEDTPDIPVKIEFSDGKKEKNQFNNKWEEVGLHRQLSSFFFNMLIKLAFNLPHLFITLAIYSRFIQPFPQVQGAVGWVGSIFGALFIILDMGTSIALSKFFAANRISSPNQAVKYAQIYVYWMLIATSTQATIVVFIGNFILPSTYLGSMSIYLVLGSITRLPGFFGVIGLVLDSMQRFDIKIKLDAILGYIINVIISYSIILACRAWFGANPRFGEAYGAGIGIFLGGWTCSIVNFILFVIIFKRLGYSITRLLCVEF